MRNKNRFANRTAGFTLIEVLVALAILSIALTTVIKVTAQNIKDTQYLQDKSIANWVGTDIINEVRIGLLKPPSEPDSMKQTTIMLNQPWPWKAYFVASSNPHIREIHVDVFQRQKNQKLASLVSYLYVTK